MQPESSSLANECAMLNEQVQMVAHQDSQNSLQPSHQQPPSRAPEEWNVALCTRTIFFTRRDKICSMTIVHFSDKTASGEHRQGGAGKYALEQ